jgi:hypothetical protein
MLAIYPSRSKIKNEWSHAQISPYIFKSRHLIQNTTKFYVPRKKDFAFVFPDVRVRGFVCEYFVTKIVFTVRSC